MSGREVGWLVFLAGLPFAHLVFRPTLDIWHGQAAWAHLWIILLASSGLIRPSLRRLTSPALWAWCLWGGGSVWWQWQQITGTQRIYPFTLLSGSVHLLFILLCYHAMVTQWRREWLPVLMLWLSRAVLIVMAYCLLQIANLDQFFSNLDKSQLGDDPLVGTIGNGSHLAAYLACGLPLCFLRARQDRRWWGAALLCTVIILLTKSAGGLLACGVVWVYWVWRHARWWGVCAGMLVVVGAVIVISPHVSSWLNPYGRFEAWAVFWTYFQQRPITGFGPGFIHTLSRTVENGSPIFQWRHVHNEYFQIAIEQGVLGVSCLVWFAIERWRRLRQQPSNDLLVTALLMLLALSITSLVNFSCHLWVIGSLGLVALAIVDILTEEPDAKNV